MTETFGILWSQLARDRAGNIASLGLPLPSVQVKITSLDSLTSTSLQAYQVGEICMRGPQIMLKYLNYLHEIVDEDGWVETGDIGYFDESGFFYVVDRRKDLIKYKGCQISPKELELLLMAHDEVEEAAVVGINDNINGQIPRAFVVPKGGKSLDLNGIVQYVAGR